MQSIVSNKRRSTKSEELLTAGHVLPVHTVVLVGLIHMGVLGVRAMYNSRRYMMLWKTKTCQKELR